MQPQRITVKIFRCHPAAGKIPGFDAFQVPLTPGSSAMDVLDYISAYLDPTLAFYDHAACSLGICGQCTAKINGKPGLLCQTLVEGDLTIEPLHPERVIRDLVVQ
jgi:fumarate reductase iron-sulfur subunit